MTLKPLLNKFTPNSLPGNHSATCLKNTLVLTLALLRRQTVCLNKLKAAVGPITGKLNTKANSHYKRLVRFFDDYAGTSLWIDLICLGLKLLRLDFEHLIIDGTSWQRGDGTWHHYLTLCIVYREVAIPIYWVDLAKRGSSSYAERVALFTQAATYFKLSGKTLLADREYIGTEWFKFLIDNHIDFIIRSRDQSYFNLIDRTSAAGARRIEDMIDKVLRSKKPAKAVRIAFTLADGTALWAVIAKNPHPEAREDFMILLTNRDQDPYRSVVAYRKRWKIEHCFRQLKSNGFELENVNLATESRQRLLLAVVVFAYIVSVVESLKHYAREVNFKVQGSAGLRYRATSVFRNGLDNLAKHTANLLIFCSYLCREIKQNTKGYRSINLLNV